MNALTPDQIKANVARNMAARNDERNDLISYISDEYKGLHGIRPRWIKFSEMTLQELREEANRLEAEIKAEIARERKERRAAAIKIADAYHRTEWSVGEIAGL